MLPFQVILAALVASDISLGRTTSSIANTYCPSPEECEPFRINLVCSSTPSTFSSTASRAVATRDSTTAMPLGKHASKRSPLDISQPTLFPSLRIHHRTVLNETSATKLPSFRSGSTCNCPTSLSKFPHSSSAPKYSSISHFASSESTKGSSQGITSSYPNITSQSAKKSTRESSAFPIIATYLTQNSTISRSDSKFTSFTSKKSTTTKESYTVRPTCVPKIVDVFAGTYEDQDCDLCSVLIPDTLQFVPPLICYEEIVVARVMISVDSRGKIKTSSVISLPLTTPTGFKVYTLYGTATPTFPIIDLTVIGMKGTLPCYTLTARLTAAIEQREAR